MLKKLKRHLILVTMAMVTLLLAGSVLLMYHVTRINLENDSIRAMQAVAMTPDPLVMEPGDSRLSIFTLRRDASGNITVTGGESYDLSDEETLQELYRSADESHNRTGVLREYGLRFLKAGKPGDSYIVFADMSAENAMLRHLLRNMLIFAAAAFAGLLWLSVFLARRAVRPVEESFRRQKQFIADASHELKTPLAVIMADSEMLAGNPEEEDRRKLTSDILDMSKQMRGLIEQMLDLARVENGSSGREPEPVNLSEIAENTCLTMEALLFEQGHMLETDIAPDLQVIGDPDRLTRLIQIFLDNAGKYADPGTPVRVSLSREKGKEVVLSSENQCESLSPDDGERLFERFYRGDSARSMTGSYGLGLPIAAAIAESCGGSIRCEIQNGKVVFRVRLKEARTRKS